MRAVEAGPEGEVPLQCREGPGPRPAQEIFADRVLPIGEAVEGPTPRGPPGRGRGLSAVGGSHGKHQPYPGWPMSAGSTDFLGLVIGMEPSCGLGVRPTPTGDFGADRTVNRRPHGKRRATSAQTTPVASPSVRAFTRPPNAST